MVETQYEYRGLMASTWDFFRGDKKAWEDSVFYRALIDQYGQPVLDVGCGTGRLLIDYIADGLDVDGVDNSPEMLELCREKAQQQGLTPNLYAQWMETLDLPRKYRTILVPSSSFQLVTDRDKALQALKQFHAHMEPGAVLVIAMMTNEHPSDPDKQDQWGDWFPLAEKTREDDGAVVRRWIRGKSDAEYQHTENRYEIEIGGEIIESETITQSPALRWYSQEQARQICESAGFRVVQIYNGFEFKPASADSKGFTVVAEKPAS